MKSRKIITSSIIALTLLGSSAPVLAGASTLQTNTNQVQNTGNLQVSQEFIDKFNDAVKLTDGKFVVDSSLLPEGTTREEINKLNKVILERNANMGNISDIPSENVVITDNSIVIGETREDAQYEADENKIIQVRKYREGSNYVHQYWWGFRIGIKKSTIRSIGTGASNLGWLTSSLSFFSKIPVPYAKAAQIVSWAISGVGIAAKSAPGGIVFNSSVPFAAVWGVGFQ